MNTPSYPYGTIAQYINEDESTTEIIAEPEQGGMCNGCVFNGAGKCSQAPECDYLIWKEAV